MTPHTWAASPHTGSVPLLGQETLYAIPLELASVWYVYPDVDPAVAELASRAYPKYSSPAPWFGVRLDQVVVPPSTLRVACTSRVTEEFPAVVENSCPAHWIVPGVVPDQAMVTVAADVAVTVPRNTCAVDGLNGLPPSVVPAVPSFDHVTFVLDMDDGVLEVLFPVTSNRMKSPMVCGVSENVVACDWMIVPTAAKVTAPPHHVAAGRLGRWRRPLSQRPSGEAVRSAGQLGPQVGDRHRRRAGG